MSNPKSLLSPEELESLVEGLESGEVNTTPLGSDAEAEVRAYSLVSNDTTSRGQLAALEMINDRLSRQLRGSFLTLLRQAVKVSAVPFEVMSFGAHIKSIPTPCNVNIVRYPPLRGYGLITMDTALVYGAVDSFFGGRGGAAVEMQAQRGFTPTEERIIQLMLDSVFSELKEAWSPVYALAAEYVSREINPAFAQVGEDRETVVVCPFDVELSAGVSGRINIMYPFSALKPIRLLLRGRLQAGERDERQAAQWTRKLEEAVLDAELNVVGQLTSFRLSAMELAAISVGDTLWFKQPQAVRVIVQQNHLFNAEYGAVDNTMALRVQGLATDPTLAASANAAAPKNDPAAKPGSRAA